MPLTDADSPSLVSLSLWFLSHHRPNPALVFNQLLRWSTTKRAGTVIIVHNSNSISSIARRERGNTGTFSTVEE